MSIEKGGISSVTCNCGYNECVGLSIEDKNPHRTSFAKTQNGFEPERSSISNRSIAECPIEDNYNISLDKNENNESGTIFERTPKGSQNVGKRTLIRCPETNRLVLQVNVQES